jgi:pilus assembly protein CpaF
VDGPALSIRKFAASPYTLDRLIDNGTLTTKAARLLRGLVEARLNVLISGGTGSGKTTLLNAMSSFIGHSERIVTIEDAAELQLQQEHVVRLETRPPNAEGSGAVSQRDLVRNALRMRPDRIIVGEVRGAECFDMLQAMTTGHDGSMTTVHANTARDALGRLEQMVTMIGADLPARTIRAQIAAGIHVVVQLNRLSDGRRRVMSISEITGMENDVITMQDIFVFRRRGKSETGEILGDFAMTGIRPKFAEALQAAGVDMDPANFRRDEVTA